MKPKGNTLVFAVDSLIKKKNQWLAKTKMFEIWWSWIRRIYVTKSWCAKARIEEHFILWYKVLNNFICVLKSLQMQEVAKQISIKWLRRNMWNNGSKYMGMFLWIQKDQERKTWGQKEQKTYLEVMRKWFLATFNPEEFCSSGKVCLGTRQSWFHS